MQRILLLLLLMLPFFAASPAIARENQTRLVDINLIAERITIEAGETLWIGIEQNIAPGWHTYWRNPGDSGTAPAIKWNLPKGFKIGELQWPTPKKLPYGPLLNYGYEENVVLLQSITAPADFTDAPITIEADIELLVCKEECIPEYGTYSLSLNAADRPSQSSNTLIEKARSKIPTIVTWAAQYSENQGDFLISLPKEATQHINQASPESVTFFPIDWGIVDNTAPLKFDNKNEQVTLQQKRGDRPLENIQNISGVIAFQTSKGEKKALEFSAAKNAATPPQNSQNFIDTERTDNIFIALFFALFGGLILNLMPCVFPVLSLKALSLVKIAEKHPEIARIHGLIYTAGVVLSFVAIAALLIAFKTAGAEIGWGFQLQNPYIVSCLMALLFLIGLNLLGIFEIKNPFANTGNTLASGSGYSATFFTGVLAALVATPCTAPFMAGAIAYALLQSEAVALIVFAALGLGLALPYLLLSFVPALQKVLPKPGAWMEKFKKILSIPMFLAALWLGWVLLQQIGPKPHEIDFGSVYSTNALEDALKTDQPVFVEMTAAWCITCKVNHKTSIDIDATRALFTQKNVIYLIGDWTNQDPEITKYLQSYGRSGVPIYVFYGARDPSSGKRPEAVLLPQILTPIIVENTIIKQ